MLPIQIDSGLTPLATYPFRSFRECISRAKVLIRLILSSIVPLGNALAFADAASTAASKSWAISTCLLWAASTPAAMRGTPLVRNAVFL